MYLTHLNAYSSLFPIADPIQNLSSIRIHVVALRDARVQRFESLFKIISNYMYKTEL